MASTNTGVVPTELVVGSLKLQTHEVQTHEVLLELEIVKPTRKRDRVVRGNTNELQPTAVDMELIESAKKGEFLLVKRVYPP